MHKIWSCRFLRRILNCRPIPVACVLSALLSVKAGNAATIDLSDSLDLVRSYCGDCHNQDDYAGGLDLTQALDESLNDNADIWEKVIRKLRAGMMPPPDQQRPARDRYIALVEALEQEIDGHAVPNPGSKTLHRLNRTEYANAIRDLLALEIDPALYLPSDTLARGFDNMAGSLALSPTQLEAYTSAASRIAAMALGFVRSPGEATYLPPADSSQNMQLEGQPFGTRGGMEVTHTFPTDGEYRFIIQSLRVGTFIPGEKLEVSIDGQRVHLFDFANLGRGRVEGGEGDLNVILPITAGSHHVGVTFLATNYRPSFSTIRQFARKSLENEILPGMQNHPEIGLLRIQGPFNPVRTVDSPSIRKVYSCRPANIAGELPCAREILGRLAKLAYRRPVGEDDLAPLMEFYALGREKGSFEDGIELAVSRILASPRFLLRTEQEPAGLAAGETFRISDLELASRLSFFLWSSIPDETLIDVAATGTLRQPDVLQAQVRRMLADPRAESLVTTFAAQWFYLRNLPSTFPDGIYYPDWDDELRQGFRRETELLFNSIVQEDRPITTLLDADYTFVNERLAKHYGIPYVFGPQFRRVSLGPELDYRRGLLGQGSFLAVTYSQNFRTSPVKRGVWVLENILGTPPPNPPANVPALEETGAGMPITSLRQQMTLHRQDPVCASCHQLMDGIGFALENFDADGKWRDSEGHPRKWDGMDHAIDTNVTLWDGSVVSSPAELRQVLLGYSPQFVRFAVEKLLTFGLGRGVEYFDMPVIRRIVSAAEEDDYRFSSLVMGVVNSDPFQMRVKEEQ
jgi:mono/diheme cytochrome c family protein